MRDIVLALAPRGRSIDVLDIGCGNGALAFRLADALPTASVVGIDISPANVAVATARRRDEASGDRVRFVCADYRTCPVAPVDLIVTDTALHFIAGNPDALWRKLSGDLRSGGIVVCAMAYDCAHNRRLRTARRILRALRSTALDRVLLSIARRQFGGEMDDDLLRERIEYMYIPPEQLMTARVRDHLTRELGLRLISEMNVPGASATQLKQHVTVFRKD
jgi:SAM-dependent methyltransferase